MLSVELELIKTVIEREAKQKNHAVIGIEHLLLGLLMSQEVRQTLQALSVDIDELGKRLEQYLDNTARKTHTDNATLSSGQKLYSVSCDRIFRRAFVHLQASGRDKIEIGALDMLVSLSSEKDSYGVQLLLEYGVTRLRLLRYVSHQVDKPTIKISLMERVFDEDDKDASRPKNKQSKTKDDPLEQYAINLNQKAQNNQTDPLIGRTQEIERVAQILCRRRKNNPLLVGDPGVGKTAIAEGLAWLIVNKKAPAALQNSLVYNLDLASLVAGTKFRGDFETRMKQLLEALKERTHVILFIDEIHTIIGAGSSMQSSMDMSNLIKPALASGQLRCIGSTTFEEYRQIFEKDHALSRRFQKVDVTEPSIDETIQILQGLKSHYEDFHGVCYSDDAIKAAVELSVKHIHERFLPDKAIDVIDEAGAKLRLMQTPTDNLPTTAKSADHNSFHKLSTNNLSTDNLSAGNTDTPTNTQVIDTQVIDKRPLVDVDKIEAIIASMARIPPKSVSSDDLLALSTLKDDLKHMVFGQEDAIDKLTDVIMLSKAGLKSVIKPIGSFVFAGPTGVGKTEIARQLALTLGIPLIRFDMSEYMEPHAVSRLIGSPPGYVGHDKGGLLTEKIHQSPHAVLLLDELEKAHSDIYNILLQVMDHGTLTDNNGRSVSFRQVILIMTTNVGADALARNSMGFTQQDHTSDNSEAIKRAFSPEFRNRLDGIVQFSPLNSQSVVLVVDKFINELQQLLDDKQVVMTLTDDAKAYLAKKGYDPMMGARPMARLINDELKKPLAEQILFGQLTKGGHVVVDEQDGGLIFEFDPAQA